MSVSKVSENVNIRLHLWRLYIVWRWNIGGTSILRFSFFVAVLLLTCCLLAAYLRFD